MTWQQILRTNFTRVEPLASFLEIDSAQILQRPEFPISVPRRLAEKMEKGNVDDPLFRQFVGRPDETQEPAGFCIDAVGDQAARKAPRLLHKYQGRCLLLTTSACAMHCRYCFRQGFDYAKGPFVDEIDQIAQDKTLSEVILSGGDPLSLPNERLGDLIERLEAIPHIKHLRFHTRFPIGIPERIDEGFLNLLQTRLRVWFVIHCNHPRELDSDVLSALAKLPGPILNQAVLLKGVNDSLPVLKELCQGLIDHGILPYYLHQLDRAKGTAHFEVDPDQGQKLIAALSRELPGYAVPRYVQEIAGAPSKVPIVS